MTNSDDDFEEPIIVTSKRKPRPVLSSRTKVKSGSVEKEKKWDFFDQSGSKTESLFIPSTEVIDLEADSEEEIIFKEIKIIAEDEKKKENEHDQNAKRKHDIPDNCQIRKKEKRKKSVTPPPTLMKSIASNSIDLAFEDDSPLVEEVFGNMEPIILDKEYMLVNSSSQDKIRTVVDLEMNHSDEIQIEIHHEPREGQSKNIEKNLIMVSKWKPISKFLDQVALQRGFSREDTVLSFKGVHIFPSASLGSVGVSFGDIIQSFYKQDFLLSKTKRSNTVLKELEGGSENICQNNEQNNTLESDNESLEIITIKINFANKNPHKVQVKLVS